MHRINKKYESSPDTTQNHQFPDGWHEITEHDFLEYINGWGFNAVEHRTMYPDGDFCTKPVIGNLFWRTWEKTGVAIAEDRIYDKKYNLTRKARFFYFGCKHEWGGQLNDDELARVSGRCLHGQKCKLCGYFRVLDSSD